MILLATKVMIHLISMNKKKLMQIKLTKTFDNQFMRNHYLIKILKNRFRLVQLIFSKNNPKLTNKNSVIKEEKLHKNRKKLK
jgi:hypothetical protein